MSSNCFFVSNFDATRAEPCLLLPRVNPRVNPKELCKARCVACGFVLSSNHFELGNCLPAIELQTSNQSWKIVEAFYFFPHLTFSWTQQFQHNAQTKSSNIASTNMREMDHQMISHYQRRCKNKPNNFGEHIQIRIVFLTFYVKACISEHSMAKFSNRFMCMKWPIDIICSYVFFCGWNKCTICFDNLFFNEEKHNQRMQELICLKMVTQCFVVDRGYDLGRCDRHCDSFGTGHFWCRFSGLRSCENSWLELM